MFVLNHNITAHSAALSKDSRSTDQKTLQTHNNKGRFDYMHQAEIDLMTQTSCEIHVVQHELTA